MEEEKAAAYYDELTRKGEGAARFKRGLGFSSGSGDDQHDAVPQRGPAFVSLSSSFLSSFVRASSPTATSKLEKESQLHSIQNKLKKKPVREVRVSERDRDKHSRRRSRSRSRSRSRERRRRSRSRSRERRRRRSKSMSPRRGRERSRSRSPHRERKSDLRRRSSRSLSPRESRRSGRHGTKEGKSKKEKNGAVYYSRLIKGYDSMSPAERVKAKMKLQLAETAEKDPTKGSGWEWFEFDKDAPLDDEEIEVAEDDASLVKHIGHSFRFSAIEAKREEQRKTAHDEAIFGTSKVSFPVTPDGEPEEENLKRGSDNNDVATDLLSEKVLAKQPGSWRDRVRKT